MTPRDVAAWEGFAAALAGVCAVLAGLVFLAVSLNIGLCAVIVATANAWVLLVEVVRDERYAPIDDTAGADVAGTEKRPA
jgi:hypothetical protein